MSNSNKQTERSIEKRYPRNFNPSNKKLIVDIVPPRKSVEKVRVQQSRQRADKVEIATEKLAEDKRTDNIARMWSGMGRVSDRSHKAAAGFGFAGLKNKRLLIGALLAAAVLLIAGGLVYGKARARIVLEPVKSAINSQFRVVASINAFAVDEVEDVVPGQKFSASREFQASFEATGQKEVAQKAEGIITIFNTTTSPQTLVATTRFESPAGLIFRIPGTIVVPPATQVGDELTPGAIESEVAADRAGAEYNIGPTRFTIPGFEGRPQFTQFYAQSDAPMTGGIIGPSSVVTEQDILRAQVELSEKLKAELINALNDKAGNLKIIGGPNVIINTPESDIEAGFAAGTFSVAVSGSAEIITFREEDITDLIEAGKLDREHEMRLLMDETAIEYSDSSTNDAGDAMEFLVKINGRAVNVFDEIEIKNHVLGMPLTGARDYFQNLDGIEKVKIMLSPFWIKKLPADESRINLEIKI